jgi:hypothetical protein
MKMLGTTALLQRSVAIREIVLSHEMEAGIFRKVDSHVPHKMQQTTIQIQ